MPGSATPFRSAAHIVFYFDFGTEELDGQYEPHQRLVDEIFFDLGYKTGEDYDVRKFAGEGHNEDAWSRRVKIPLEFLLSDD